MFTDYGFVSRFDAGFIGQCTSSITLGALMTYQKLKTPGDNNAGFTKTTTTITAPLSIIGISINGLSLVRQFPLHHQTLVQLLLLPRRPVLLV